ncbi:MAG: spore coat protein CotH, partial [Ruminiclostridium sp.]|nr:spore coat protein CotH [Ruminiclostridium sp.]
TICDLMYGKFSYENANKVIDEKIQQCDKECMYALDHGITSSWANEHTFNDSRNQIRDFFKNRESIMIKDMKKVFGYGDEMYTVTVNTGKGGEVYLNSVKISSESTETRNYFEECSVALTAKAYAGYKFLYWDINGERSESDKITVDSKMSAD